MSVQVYGAEKVQVSHLGQRESSRRNCPKTLKTRNWEIGQRIAREWEQVSEEKALGFSLSEACDRFYSDCMARRLSNASLRKYNLLVNELKAAFGKREIGSISLDD